MDTKKLRQKLLDLAIHGKLVPQDPNDEPASELLARIREEKLAMVERGELKPKDVKGDTVIFTGSDGLPYEKRADGKDVAKCIEGEIPFEIPEGWNWARLQSLSHVITDGDHQAPPQIASGIPFLVISNIANGVICFDDTRFVPRTYFDEIKPQRVPQRGDLLLSVTGSYGIPAVVNTDRDFCFQRHIALIKPLLSANFLSRVVSSSYCSKWFDKKATGTAQKTVALSILRSTLIPVPPLAEQRRIVDVLGKYLALVDGIERDRAELDVLLAQLKSKVLDLAVRGELTERDQKDEPASELLARIREDKLAMVARGELKPKDVKNDTVIFTGSDGLRYEKRADGKGEAKCIEKEIPFEVPEGWAWARLGTVCSLLRRGKSPVYTDDASIPVFAQKCNQPWGITLEKVKFLNRSALDRYGETLKLRSGDIVVNSTGTGTLGRVGVFDEGLLGDYPFIVPDSHVAVVRIIQPFESKYIFHLLRSEYGQGLIFSKQTGSTNQKELPAKEIALFLIPVPPLAEQWRIVKRIEKLFNLLD